jgi:outer membrane protein TolC
MTLGKAAERAAAAVTESRRAFYPELYGRLSLDYVQNSMVREQTIMAATVGLKVNFFDGFASSATQRKATLEHARAQAALADAAEKVKLEIVTTRNDMVVAQEKLSVAETSIIQGKENLRINEERYKERVGTATEVLDAQTLLAQAQNDYYQALYQLQVVKARYQKAIGNLL